MGSAMQHNAQCASGTRLFKVRGMRSVVLHGVFYSWTKFVVSAFSVDARALGQRGPTRHSQLNTYDRVADAGGVGGTCLYVACA